MSGLYAVWVSDGKVRFVTIVASLLCFAVGEMKAWELWFFARGKAGIRVRFKMAS